MRLAGVAFALGTVVASAAPLVAQDAGARRAAFASLSLPWIMKGPEIVGREPTGVRWSPDGQWVFFQWLPPGRPWQEPLRPFRVRASAGAVPESLSSAKADSLAPLFADGPRSPDGKRRVVSVQGDLFLIDLPRGTIHRLTNTPSVNELDPSFDQTGSKIFFRRDNNLFAFDVGSFGVEQLTDIRIGPAPDSLKPTAQQERLAAEERTLFNAVRDKLWRDSVERAEQTARKAEAPKPIYLDRTERVRLLVPSPTGRELLLFTTTAPAGRIEKVPNYVTASGYLEEIDARPKAGDGTPKQRVGVVSLPGGNIRWVAPIPGDSTNLYANLTSLGWNDEGSSALLWVISRDFTERRVVRVDAAAGPPVALDVLRDSTWASWGGGPCAQCAGWLPENRGVWFTSEADGYSHLYTVAADGTGRTQRTRGTWEISSATLTPDRSAWLLHTTEASPFEQHAYRLPVAGGAMERLTKRVGGHTVVLSPDGGTMADLFSTSNRPPELFIQPARADATPIQLTTSPTAEWLAKPWLDPEIIRIPASDGAQVPARIYRPEQVGAKRNGAAVIFVHGAGYLHNVHRYWSIYYREYMFHHLLASQGYLVLDLDYRASAGYGRDWRTAIYRHMGGRDLQDQVDASRYLGREFGIPPKRVGIYGGSYGGFITLMALFTESPWFGAGAALRAVTQWSHYSPSYSGAILNDPQDDSVAYRQSSPIYFAEGLKAPLLMAHGMVDVNVHFSDIVRLTQRLIELGKKDWELAVYPVEDHGFVRPDSWTDEYRRILALFDRALRGR
jgi:dipeptidyl aminopeptidase/acylaminoacyl peptidase